MIDSLTLTQLKNLKLPEGSYVVAGTVPLQLYDINFIDAVEAHIIATPELYKQQLEISGRWSLEFPDTATDTICVTLMESITGVPINMYNLDNIKVNGNKYTALKDCLLTAVHFYGIPFISLEDLYRWNNKVGTYSSYVKCEGIKHWLIANGLWMGNYGEKFDGD